MPYLTPDDAGGILLCRQLRFRAEIAHIVTGALERLIHVSEWELFGTLTPDECALAARDMLDHYFDDKEGCAMIGEVLWLATQSYPDWFLLCDGRELWCDDYPELSAAINDAYRVDSARFTIPNLIDKFPRGNALPASEGGNAQHTLSVNEMPAHDHQYDKPVGQFLVVAPGEDPVVEIILPFQNTGSAGGSQAFDIMNPYHTLIPVIRARYPDESNVNALLLAYDSFTDTQAVWLDDHAPDFSVGVGNWQPCRVDTTSHASHYGYIDADQGYQTFTGGGYYLDLAWSDVEVACDATLSAGGQRGIALIARLLSDGNMYFLRFMINTGVIEIVKKVAGADVVLASTTLSWSDNVRHRYSFRVVGTALSALIDGAIVLNAVDGTYNGTKHGIAKRGSGGNAHYDNVRILKAS